VQGIFWKLNKFEKLKDIQALQNYESRHDPTVVQLLEHGQEPFSLVNVQGPARRRDERAYYTCADYHELYKSGKLTPTAVVESLLPLISRESTPPGEHSVAFLESKADIIRKAAAASTARYASGKPMSVLDGVPLAVKDEADLANYSRTLGTKLDFTNAANKTAWCVEKWEAAGGIVVGKTNMHEMG
jgi:Asp-tRNA(Asn)/Glu-tRNA(Gln) amidotransferase A subunit family amidase